MPTLAEERVKQLAKLKTNTICPNCGNQKKFGFGTVCIKFLTFVCNECKSSHQAISHRCKSLTMSSWSNDEVEALARGGNLMARRTWLKNAPPEGSGGRPKPGMDINVYKRFIVEAYEHKRYYGELDPNDGMAPSGSAAPAPAVAKPRQTHVSKAPIVTPRRPASTAQARAQQQQPKPPPPIRQPVVAAPPVVADLLDFGAPAAGAPVAAPPAGNVDMFSADFGAAFSQPAAASPAPAAGFDAFAPTTTTTSQPAVPSSSSDLADPFAFGAFGASDNANNNAAAAKPPAPAPASSDPFNFGAFGSSLPNNSPNLNTMSSAQPSAAGKKPIMGGPSAGMNASAISMMGGGPQNTGMRMPPSMVGGGMASVKSNNNSSTNPMMMMGNTTGMGGMNMNMNMNMMNPQMMAMMQNQMMMGGGMPMGAMNNNNMMMMGNPNNNMMMNPGGGMGMNAMNMTPAMMQDQQRKFQQMMNQNNNSNAKF
ncbi:ArfGap [Seminavis robusta]|uniref:ArfGap n=1 Tax=Seminavis robusta TaxID=568900 RepID=A0A9N8DQ95_9STRA|nr:ArfGap [Seminavis robusta]|eukprot:Sro277_g106380.1 ArfGap (480) ;mRNA; f:63760-65199